MTLSSADNSLQTVWTKIRTDILSRPYQGPDCLTLTNVTAKTDISKCLSLLFGKLKLCIFLSFIVLCLLQPTANYDLAIIEDYLPGNAKIKILIKTKWRWRSKMSHANFKGGFWNFKKWIKRRVLLPILCQMTF